MKEKIRNIHFKGGEKLKEEKLEQLRKVFKAKIKDIISKAKLTQAYFETDDYIQKIADGFVYEVKIRGTERKE